MRAMLLEFPNDPTCWHLDRQYLLGPALLVAPVMSSSGGVEYYLPEGNWTNYTTGMVREGGRWIREIHGMMSLPLFVRENSLLPVGADETRPDSEFHASCKILISSMGAGAVAACRIPRPDGTIAGGVRARLLKDELHIEWSGDLPDVSFEWLGRHEGCASDQADLRGSARGLTIFPRPGVKTITVSIGNRGARTAKPASLAGQLDRVPQPEMPEGRKA